LSCGRFLLAIAARLSEDLAIFIGFAAVASKVRNLAQRSAGATKKIKTLIDDSLVRVVVEESAIVASCRY